MNSRARRPIRMTRLGDNTIVKSCKPTGTLIGAEWHDFTCSSTIKSIQSALTTINIGLKLRHSRPVAHTCIRMVAVNMIHDPLTGDNMAAYAMPIFDLGRVRADKICRREAFDILTITWSDIY